MTSVLVIEYTLSQKRVTLGGGHLRTAAAMGVAYHS